MRWRVAGAIVVGPLAVAAMQPALAAQQRQQPLAGKQKKKPKKAATGVKVERITGSDSEGFAVARISYTGKDYCRGGRAVAFDPAPPRPFPNPMPSGTQVQVVPNQVYVISVDATKKCKGAKLAFVLR